MKQMIKCSQKQTQQGQQQTLPQVSFKETGNGRLVEEVVSTSHFLKVFSSNVENGCVNAGQATKIVSFSSVPIGKKPEFPESNFLNGPSVWMRPITVHTKTSTL